MVEGIHCNDCSLTGSTIRGSCFKGINDIGIYTACPGLDAGTISDSGYNNFYFMWPEAKPAYFIYNLARGELLDGDMMETEVIEPPIFEGGSLPAIHNYWYIEGCCQDTAQYRSRLTAMLPGVEFDPYLHLPHHECLPVGGIEKEVSPSIVVDLDAEGLTPANYNLAQNFPNPFNSAATIEFALPRSADVAIQIFNITGQKVKTLTNGALEAGNHSVIWDCTDSEGKSVASGIYLYRLKAGEFIETKKMILLK